MKNLTKKMVEILKVVSGKVNKSGYNSHNNYKYVMEADLLDVLREEVAKKGIYVYPSVESLEYSNGITTVRLKHTIVDSESGDLFEVFSAGQGADKQDKGVYKAITGATKYFWMKTFMMAGDDDPETDKSNAGPAKLPLPEKSSPKAKGPFKAAPSKSTGFGKTKTFAKSVDTDMEAEAKLDSAMSLEDVPF